MKKLIALLLMGILLLTAFAGSAESALSENAQLIVDSIRWNMNLPKTCNVVRAEEYLYKLRKDITVHALLMVVTPSEEVEMIYGTGGKLMVIDLETGEVLDYKTFNGNTSWPDDNPDYTQSDALNLLYNCYWSYVEGYNDFIMGDQEFITPLEADELEAINATLNGIFSRE